MWIGRNRKARVTYGFDEIALVPGDVTINPNEVDISFRIPRRDAEPIKLNIPILASAMDGVVDVKMAIEMGKLGGLGVLNLEGVQTRYENPDEVLAEVVAADKEKVTTLIQKLYQEPMREELIARRVEEIKRAGVICCGQLHSAKSRALRRHRPGSRRGRLCRPVHRFDRPAHFHGVQDARPGWFLQGDEGAGHRRQHGYIQCHARADANRRRRGV